MIHQKKHLLALLSIFLVMPWAIQAKTENENQHVITSTAAPDYKFDANAYKGSKLKPPTESQLKYGTVADYDNNRRVFMGINDAKVVIDSNGCTWFLLENKISTDGRVGLDLIQTKHAISETASDSKHPTETPEICK